MKLGNFRLGLDLLSLATLKGFLRAEASIKYLHNQKTNFKKRSNGQTIVRMETHEETAKVIQEECKTGEWSEE